MDGKAGSAEELLAGLKQGRAVRLLVERADASTTTWTVRPPAVPFVGTVGFKND